MWREEKSLGGLPVVRVTPSLSSTAEDSSSTFYRDLRCDAHLPRWELAEDSSGDKQIARRWTGRRSMVPSQNYSSDGFSTI